MNLMSTVAAEERDANLARGERFSSRLEVSAATSRGATIDIVIHDLSTKGMLIETADGLSVGDHVALGDFNQALPNAAVAWSSGPFHGCTFTEPIAESLVYEVILSGRADMAAEAEKPELANPVRPASQILKLRQRQGLTTEEFANLIGVSRQAVWYWETGQRKPRGEQIRKIEEIFGSSVDSGAGQGALSPVAAEQSQPSACIDSCKEAIAKALGIDASSIRISIDF